MVEYQKVMHAKIACGLQFWMQSSILVACFNAVRLFIFVHILWTLQPHFTLWLSARTMQCLFVWGCACHNAFVLNLGLTSSGISVPLCSSVVPSEQIVLRMRMSTWGSASNAITKRSVKQVSVARCQAKFLTYYFLSIILLLTVKE